MTQVCADWFPMGSYKYQYGPGFMIEPLLKMQLDFLIKNISRDWAFTIIISGRGEVRVGKSILAQQIAAYWIYEVNRLYGKDYRLSVKDNYVFNGNELIAKGNQLGTHQPYTAIVYDEAGADIQGVKVMSSETKEVMDYLRECGQYNMLTILVLPDFFSLPRPIALTYSTFLIDVTYYADEQGYLERGYFKFYSRPAKKKLYLWGKKELDYDAAKMDFRGDFNNVYTVNEAEYRQAKKDALKKREKALGKKERALMMARDIAWFKLYTETELGVQGICDLYSETDGVTVTYDTVLNGINNVKKLYGLPTETAEDNINFETIDSNDIIPEDSSVTTEESLLESRASDNTLVNTSEELNDTSDTLVNTSEMQADTSDTSIFDNQGIEPEERV